MQEINAFMDALNGILWHDSVLFLLLGTGILFTFWSGFGQYRALTHGVQVTRGVYDDARDPGAINHFQALSAALSATVGLGNIGGVALAIALGGPGAVFWMWVVGFFGMAIKLTEVTLAMLYRNTDDPDNPHGGPMWVASKGLARMNPKLAGIGKVWGGIFCLTLLVSTITGGNMFQAWNVGEITEEYFGIPSVAVGIVMSLLVGGVIIGGIKRIGAVAATLVPFMIGLYLLASFYVLFMNAGEIPDMFRLIVTAAFSTEEASGAFIGGTMGYAFLFGMKRALFSNEAGQGSSPIAHSAAKTAEPVREGVVAGLEPFIDTLIVCTLTAVVILITGVWNRPAEATYENPPAVVSAGADRWSLETLPAPQPEAGAWRDGENVFTIVTAHENEDAGNNLHRLGGFVRVTAGGTFIDWRSISSEERPQHVDGGVYAAFVGATLTAKAFDSVTPGLGKWLVTLAVWLFAISTMISWSYYGEQGMIYLLGERSVLPYKVAYCLLIIIATMGFIRTDAQLDNLTGIGTGVMLFANIPIMWLFGRQAMRAYHEYMGRLKDGRMGPDHPRPKLEDVISGRDVS
ncbi:MAG: sodium:alanine symporter family protein [Gammaproteobacteria bacterium]|nr:sodium:alanine symporter family protein [Gammaproteobacteria bacterium]